MKQSQAQSLKLNPKAVPKAVCEALLALGLGCRDIRNSTLHSLRNLYFSYSWDKEKKLYVQGRFNGEPLAAEQLSAVALANATLDAVEAERKAREEAKGRAFKPKARFGAELPGKDFWNLLLDKTLAERMLKEKERRSGGKFVDHGELPSIYAQAAVHQTVDEFSVFRKSLIAWFQSRNSGEGQPDDGSGIPKPPGYSAKGARASFELDASQCLRAGGNLPRILEGNRLWREPGKTGPVPLASIAAFNAFDFRSVIEKRMADENLPPGALSLATIRVSFKKRGKKGRSVKVEAVVKESFEVADDSFMGRLLAKHPNFMGGSADEKLSVVKSMLSARAGRGKAADFKEKLPAMAGLDLGLTNLGTLGFSESTLDLPHEVLAGKKAAQIIAKRQKRLDAIVESKALGEVKRLRELQLKNDLLLDEVDRLKAEGCLSLEDEAKLLAGKSVLGKKEIDILHAFQSDLYKDKDYCKARIELEDFVDQTCHRVSRLVVERLKARGVELLVCGKNAGWKQESGLGRRMNRRFHSIPHARILKLIEYKAFLEGIVVVCQEESYTSKSSFVSSDPLPVHSPKNAGKNQPFSGKRTGNVFQGPKHKLHADVNGALNILRKAVPRFAYTKSLHLGHRILGVGPGDGSPCGLRLVSGRPLALQG